MSCYLSDLVDDLKNQLGADVDDDFDLKLSIKVNGMIIPVESMDITPYEIILKPRTE